MPQFASSDDETSHFGWLNPHYGALKSPILPQNPGKGVAKTITKQRVESHFDLELRAAVMSLGPGRYSDMLQFGFTVV
jgi:hypothetical protein